MVAVSYSSCKFIHRKFPVTNANDKARSGRPEAGHLHHAESGSLHAESGCLHTDSWIKSFRGLWIEGNLEYCEVFEVGEPH